jgi:hypothetical protein
MAQHGTASRNWILRQPTRLWLSIYQQNSSSRSTSIMWPGQLQQQDGVQGSYRT